MVDIWKTERQYLRPKEVAELLDVSERTIARWIERGALEGFQVLGTCRVPVAALRLLLAKVNHPTGQFSGLSSTSTTAASSATRTS